MNAAQLSRQTNEIRARHRRHQRYAGASGVVPCETCQVLEALVTAIGRRWDPFTGGPLDGIRRDVAQRPDAWLYHVEIVNLVQLMGRYRVRRWWGFRGAPRFTMRADT